MKENNRLEGRPLDSPTLDMGTTTEPVNARAPQYTVTVTPDGDQFRATVALSQTAFEGNVESIYTNWGTYFTGHYWLSDADARFSGANTAAGRTVSPAAVISVADKDYVYMNVSRAMARLSKQAEEEHLSDFRRAYQISLQAAETAIRSVRDLAPPTGYGPYATAVDARNDIATRIHNVLPPASQGLNVDQTQWLTNYLTLCQRSKYRDGQNWHSFDIAESSFWYNSRFLRAVTETWDIYADHPETQVHYVDVTPGPSIAVGTHTSATVIHF